MNPDAVAGVQSPALQALLHEHWEGTMRASPTWASRLGDHRFDDQLDNNHPDAIREHQAWRADLLLRSRALAPSAPADALTLQIFQHQLEGQLEQAACETWSWSVSPRWNPVVRFAKLHELGTSTADLTRRLEAAPAYLDQDLDNLRVGLAAGRVSNAETVRRAVEQLDGVLDSPTTEWPVPAAHPELLPLVESRLRPAVQRYRDALAQEILPAARTSPEGLTGLPDGAACYAASIREHLGVHEDPEGLHTLGLEQLEAIHSDMRVLGQELFEVSTLSSLIERLRSDPALYFETEDQVEQAAVQALARAQEAAPAVFTELPTGACEVRRIPTHEAPYATIAYYQPVSLDAPGVYYVNTWAPETRPRFEAEVLAFHESVPGHHLQIAQASELGRLPAFRRHTGSTAFVEGWALYTESLAAELGLYSGPIDHMGRLSFAAWRAARLVVDTGIHHKGWSREQAEAFMLENTALAPNNVANEVDRYITWPGQALAYRYGMLRIARLRDEAERALGADFKLEAFHDVVLGAGAVPLPVLEARVRDWIHATSQ